MRLKFKLDVRLPLKRKKEICKKDKIEVIVQCKYEKLGDFFVVYCLTHKGFVRRSLKEMDL